MDRRTSTIACARSRTVQVPFGGLIQTGGEAGLTLRRVESVSVGFVRADFIIANHVPEVRPLSERYVLDGL